MIKVDLITGFLGSGKTTFLKLYAKYFLDQGLKIGILENDYGAVNVDMLLLNDLRCDNLELEMVAGGCDADCHRRRFKTKLIAMAMTGYDRVIIEPSGIFDVDEFFDVVRDEPLDKWYEIGNVITIVDSRLEDNFSKTNDFFLASQIANAGTIILSKAQLTDENHINATIEHLKRAAEGSNLSIDLTSMIISKNWDDFTSQDFDTIANCGYKTRSYIKRLTTDNSGYKTVYFLDIPVDINTIEEKIHFLMTDNKYGNVLRAKGFFKNNDTWYQFNSTKNEFDLKEIPVGQQVFIIIGDSLNEEEIKKLISQ